MEGWFETSPYMVVGVMCGRERMGPRIREDTVGGEEREGGCTPIPRLHEGRL